MTHDKLAVEISIFGTKSRTSQIKVRAVTGYVKVKKKRWRLVTFRDWKSRKILWRRCYVTRALNNAQD